MESIAKLDNAVKIAMRQFGMKQLRCDNCHRLTTSFGKAGCKVTKCSGCFKEEDRNVISLSSNTSNNEFCPHCKQPADMFVFYGLGDFFKLQEVEVGYGCSACHGMSSRYKIDKQVIIKLLETMRDKL